jgi:hypothetical protein
MSGLSLQLLLDLASAVILGSESRGTHDTRACIAIYIYSWHGPHRKHYFENFLYYCVLIRWRGNLFTSLLSSIWRMYSFHYFGRNRVLRRIFEPEKYEVVGCWRKLHNEKLYNLYSSPSVIRMIKSWRRRWTGHVV